MLWVRVRTRLPCVGTLQNCSGSQFQNSNDFPRQRYTVKRWDPACPPAEKRPLPYIKFPPGSNPVILQYLSHPKVHVSRTIPLQHKSLQASAPAALVKANPLPAPAPLPPTNLLDPRYAARLSFSCSAIVLTNASDWNFSP